MKSVEDIRPISDLSSRGTKLFDQINEGRRPVYLTQDGVARAVLMDPQTYEDMRGALGLMKLAAQGERDVAAGRTRPQGDVFQTIADRLHAERTKTSAHGNP